MPKKPGKPGAKPPARRPNKDMIGLKTIAGARRSSTDQSIGAQRQLTEQVKTARKRSNSSARWLQRQLNDPYVAEAKRQGYRSRAAFKLIDLDDKFGFLKPGSRILDLGCAPGGWLQVATERAGLDAVVIGIDLQEVEPVPRTTILLGDILEEGSRQAIMEAAGGKLHVVMSDMAASSTGHAPTDHLRVMMLIDMGLDIAEDLLLPGGIFVAKVLQGGAQKDTLERLKRLFKKVQTFKPGASRSDSREQFLVAQGFRG